MRIQIDTDAGTVFVSGLKYTPELIAALVGGGLPVDTPLVLRTNADNLIELTPLAALDAATVDEILKSGGMKAVAVGP